MIYTNEEIKELEKALREAKKNTLNGLLEETFMSGVKVKIRQCIGVDRSATVITDNIMNPTPTIDDTVRLAVDTERGIELLVLDIKDIIKHGSFEVVNRNVHHKGTVYQFLVLISFIGKTRYSFYIKKV